MVRRKVGRERETKERTGRKRKITETGNRGKNSTMHTDVLYEIDATLLQISSDFSSSKSCFICSYHFSETHKFHIFESLHSQTTVEI